MGRNKFPQVGTGIKNSPKAEGARKSLQTRKRQKALPRVGTEAKGRNWNKKQSQSGRCPEELTDAKASESASPCGHRSEGTELE